MTRALPFSLCAIAVLCVACAGTGRLDAPAGQAIAPQDAMERVAIGKSTRPELAAALGTAIVIPFDSGFEVWVYRWPGLDRTTRSATELVVLFDPSGVATKARVRPGYAARD